MKRIVTPAEQGLDTLRFVPANLHKLLASGAIGVDAVSLALQLISKMQRERVVQTSLTMAEARTTCVYLNDKPYVGSVGSDFLHAVGALQQVHGFVGFFNHHQPQALDYAEPEVHFSSDPFENYSDQWIDSTPIFFRFDYVNMSYWSSIANEQMERCLAGANVVNVDTRGER